MWVEPQPSLMLRPSGSTAIVSTSAPSRSKIAGAARWVAPLAQSRTTLRPGEVEREGRLERAQVVLEAAVQLADPADRRGRIRLASEQRLDPRLGVVAELRPLPGEELDAVVAVGVVGGGDDRGEVEPQPLDQDRRRRSRQHAAQQRVAAGGGDPGRQRRLQHRPRLAGVAHDQHLRPLDLQRGGRSPPKRGRQLGGEERPSLSPDPVGSEELALRRHRASVSAC